MEFKAFDAVISGIDLRKELDTLFNDQKTAYWVVYRRFDLTKHSDHFVDITKEGVGGPKYEYTDELIEVRSSLIRRLSQNLEVPMPPALLQDSAVNFYMRHTVQPKIDDVIYEIEYPGAQKPASVPLPDLYTVKFNIMGVFPMRDANYGRVEYFLVYCKVANR